MKLSDNITGLQHIGIPTLDVAASCAFYEKLSFTKIFERDFDDNGNPGHAAFMQKGSLVLEIYKAAEIAGQAGAVDHIALNVQDIEAAFREINELGLNNTHDSIHFLPFFEHGVKFFTIQGPAQEKVEFNQYLKA